MRGALLYAIVLLFTADFCWSQQITVLDKISQKPIELVQIYDERQSASHTVFTDIKGGAELTKFKDSKTLYFSHPGYEAKELTVGQGLRINLVFLEPQWHSSATIEVVAKRQSIEEEDIAVSKQLLDAITSRLENPQTSADMLAQSGQVLVQKSQMGGGSPIIRGFEANRVLLVVDGVRMNNAIYRSGHLQNAITVDPHYLETTEIIFGPSSVLYGSDALGGVIHFHTKQAQFSSSPDTKEIGMNAFLRSSSANNEKMAHVDFNLGGNRLAYNLSVTGSSFGDMEMGRVRAHGYDDWGIVNQYVDPSNDRVLQNVNSVLQPRTGYEQIDVGSKLSYRLKDSLIIGLNIQYSNSSDINRWDRLNDVRDGLPRWAEWKYGPQERFFSALNLKLKGGLFYDDLAIVAAYQKIGEDRINRRLNSSERFVREEEVEVQSLNMDFSKRLARRSTVYYGLEIINNNVNSQSTIQNINTYENAPGSTRYPDGGSDMQSYAIYYSHSTKWNSSTKTNAGIRYSYTSLNADFVDRQFYDLPFENISFSNGALTGNFGMEKMLRKNLQLDLLLSSGFKSPNVDDAAKIFEKDGFVVIPNEDVKPEYLISSEVGIHRFWDERQSSFNLSVFYSRIFDALVRRDYNLNGQDSLLYEGELARIQTNLNTNEAEVYGLAASVNWEINDWFRWSSTFNYTVGNDLSEGVPLAHIPPVFGKSELIFYNESLTGAFYSYYNGWKRIEDFSPSTVDNPAEATVDGYPSWYTLNFRVSRRFSPSFSFNFAIENILDHHYKTFASGLSASGRNLIFSAALNL